MRAGWALWSKKPGSRDDYSVLACSFAPFTRADFTTIITRFSAGTPDTRSSGPGALPWVTLSWVGTDDRLQLGIAVTDGTGQVDGVGRPITQTSYFCVPYADIAETRLGYSALYRAVSGITLPPRDGEMISLPVPQPPVADPVEAVARFGERQVATAAALLLQGPVSVVQAEGATLEERLEFIDAVTSLLPFGYRARFAAATWTDSGTRHRLRLAFAARPREDAMAIAWRRPGDIPSGAGIAREYLDKFRALRGMGPATDRVFGLPVVLTHLAADTTPRKFEHSRAAVDTLLQIDLPFRVERELENDTPVELADLRQVFRQERTLELEPRGRVTLLKALSAQGEAADWLTLARRLDDVPDAETVRQILGTYGRRVLWTDEPDGGVIRDCIKVSARVDLEDGVLAALLPPPEDARGLPRAVRCAADLFAEIATADPASGDTYPLTRKTLAGAPQAVAALLAALADSVPDAERCLNWLRPDAPQDLTRLFAIALGVTPGAISEPEVMTIAGLGTYCVAALLDIASITGQLDVVLPGCARWVAAGGTPGPDVTRCLMDLPVTTARQRAWLDMTRLAAGISPSALPPPAGHRDSEPYLTDLAGIWLGLSREYALFNGDRCIRVLARYLDGQRWTVTEEQAAAVASLATWLREFDRDEELQASVMAGLTACPEAAGWEFARQWVASARPDDPKVVRRRALASLATAPPGTDASQLAVLCVRAHQENITAGEAFSQLAKSGAIDSVTAAADLMNELGTEFARSGIQRRTADHWVQVYAGAIARGEFDERLLQPFRARVLSGSRDNVKFYLDMVLILASGERPGQYELTDSERKWFTELRDDLDSVLSRSQPGFIKRHLFWSSE